MRCSDANRFTANNKKRICMFNWIVYYYVESMFRIAHDIDYHFNRIILKLRAEHLEYRYYRYEWTVIEQLVLPISIFYLLFFFNSFFFLYILQFNENITVFGLLICISLTRRSDIERYHWYKLMIKFVKIFFRQKAGQKLLTVWCCFSQLALLLLVWCLLVTSAESKSSKQRDKLRWIIYLCRIN